jgi:hypothetical protein
MSEPGLAAERDRICRPLILDLACVADRDRLAALASGGDMFSRHNTIVEQLRDLIASRHPAQRFDAAALDAQVSAHLAGVPTEDYGRWVYYPWSGRLVHLLPEEEFRELRADRNRDKITREEQQLLRRSTIGVIGLSVGQASAVTLALEGVGGGFRIADFDTLALSNLNRLRAGIHELGLNKAVLTARQMFEIDPYLDIEIFPEGITEGNLAGFLGEGESRLSVLVEECDDLLIKVAAREQARLRRIPVVMDVNDRGLVDIERFDLEPERPLFHGLATELDLRRLRGLTMEEKISHLMRLIGETTVSPRTARSWGQIRRTLSTWPQLASGVALGGALVTDVVRRILLGEMTASGRFYVDVEAIVADGTPAAER